jgi:phosphopantothenoylcysteine decarboxylase/phosphopantothenate--cysteine ligase
MGYALAIAALEAGHKVTLISGPVCLHPPSNARVIFANTAEEMFDAVHRQVKECDVLVMCAAVADYKPAVISKNKIKKRNDNFSMELTPTRDILRSLSNQDRQCLVVGFAAETIDVRKNAERKLRDKNCDVIVANDVSGAESGMESDANEVTIFFADSETKEIARAPKQNIARELVKIFSKMCENRLTKKM